MAGSPPARPIISGRLEMRNFRLRRRFFAPEGPLLVGAAPARAGTTTPAQLAPSPPVVARKMSLATTTRRSANGPSWGFGPALAASARQHEMLLPPHASAHLHNCRGRRALSESWVSELASLVGSVIRSAKTSCFVLTLHFRWWHKGALICTSGHALVWSWCQGPPPVTRSHARTRRRS